VTGDTLFLASYVALWVFVLLVGLVLFVVLRQLGIMYMGTFESARRDGLPLGRAAPEFSGWDDESTPLSLVGVRGRPRLLVVASATCPTCRQLGPVLNEFGREKGESLSILTVGVIEDGRNGSLKRALRLNVPTLERGGAEISESYKVERTPFAYLLDELGVIRAKGLVNNRDHLEYLLNEYRLSSASQQTLAPPAVGVDATRGRV